MSLDDKITNLILREPGISQNQIVKELTRDKKSSKNTVIKHVQALVKEKKIKEEKHGKFVQYFATNVETHKDIDKLIHHKLDDAFDSLDRIKKQISSYPYDAKEYLLNYLDEVKKIEERIQDDIKLSKRFKISIERHVVTQYRQIIKHVEKAELSSETKNQIYKVVNILCDKLQKLNMKSIEYGEKLRDTQNKKRREYMQKQLTKINQDAVELDSDFNKILRVLEFEMTNMEEIIAKLYERYINKKLSVYVQIQELLPKRCTSVMTRINLLNICCNIRSKISFYDTTIDEYNQQLKNDKYANVDDISYQIKYYEEQKKESEKDLEKILQYLKTKKPLVNLFEQLKQKYP